MRDFKGLVTKIHMIDLTYFHLYFSCFRSRVIGLCNYSLLAVKPFKNGGYCGMPSITNDYFALDFL